LKQKEVKIKVWVRKRKGNLVEKKNSRRKALDGSV